MPMRRKVVGQSWGPCQERRPPTFTVYGPPNSLDYGIVLKNPGSGPAAPAAAAKSWVWSAEGSCHVNTVRPSHRRGPGRSPKIDDSSKGRTDPTNPALVTTKCGASRQV